MQEFLNDVLTEDVACSSVIHRPSFSIRWIWIGPDQVTHGTGFWDVMKAIDLCDFIEIGYGWRESAMHAEYLRVYDCCERQVGEDFDNAVPDVVISVFSEDFIIEAICSGKGGCLMVASE